jgi:pimeloyl-ACP methyl ester carboxylesterase
MSATNKSTSGFAEVNGTRLYYEIAGEGYPLVLMHGGIMDNTMWDDQFAEFAQHYRVIRFDLRGFGQSDLPSGPEPYSSRGDLRALLAFLGIDRANVLGISMAGSIAIDFTLDYPNMVNALILVAPGVNGYDHDAVQSQDEKAMFQEIEAAFESDDLEHAVELETRAWVDGPNRTPEQVDPRVRKRAYAMNLRNNRRAVGLEWPATQKLTPPAIERLAEIRVSTLLIIGDGDVHEQITVVDTLATKIPGARKAVMHGVAHVPNMERPAEFNQLVLDFLKAV